MTTLEIGSHAVEISKPNKVLFPDDGITKLDLARYYERVADNLLRHSAGHPLALVRFPDGIDGHRFYQKAAPDYFPDWIERVTLEHRDRATSYVVCNDAATLVYLANQACIELHGLLASVNALGCPDRLIFDLDPSIDDFAMVRDGAHAVKDLLDRLGLPAFLMTSGSRGLHIWVPLQATDDFEAVRSFSFACAEWLADSYEYLTFEHRKDKRGDRVFVDVLRNGFGAHSAVPYSVRGKAGAPVAAPIDWAEMGSVSPQKYTVRNLFRRLSRKDDPWMDMRRQAVSLGDAPAALSDL